MVSVLVEKFAKDQKDIDDKRTMALINKPNYSLLQSSLKIDDLIDPRMTTVSSILKHIHKGTIENAYTLSDGEYEVIEASITSYSPSDRVYAFSIVPLWICFKILETVVILGSIKSSIFNDD